MTAFAKNAGVLAKSAFAEFGSAGGHKSAARAEVYLDALAGIVDTEDSTKLANWIIKRLDGF